MSPKLNPQSISNLPSNPHNTLGRVFLLRRCANFRLADLASPSITKPWKELRKAPSCHDDIAHPHSIPALRTVNQPGTPCKTMGNSGLEDHVLILLGCQDITPGIFDCITGAGYRGLVLSLLLQFGVQGSIIPFLLFGNLFQSIELLSV